MGLSDLGPFILQVKDAHVYCRRIQHSMSAFLSEVVEFISGENTLLTLVSTLEQGFLVNISRGGVIDEQELVKALLECRLGGAGLDVFEKEPHVPQELWNMDNVVLLPHVGSATWDTRRAMADLVVSNLEAQFSGNPLPTPVT